MAAGHARSRPAEARPAEARPAEARPAKARLVVELYGGARSGDIRSVALDARALLAVALALSLYVVVVAIGLAYSPSAFAGIVEGGQSQQERLTQGRLAKRLEAIVTRLGRLSAETSELRRQLDKVCLAYGLELRTEQTAGAEGGSPSVAAPDSVYRVPTEQALALAEELRERLSLLGLRVDEIRDWEAAHPEGVASTPSLSPVRGRKVVLSSDLGHRRSAFTGKDEFHGGVDLSAPAGTPIFAPADGRVLFAGRYPVRRSSSWWRFGKMIALRHEPGFLTVYGHCHKIDVRRGERVQRGESLGTVGSTGWSTHPHLHYEIWRRREDSGLRPVNPRIFMLDRRWPDEDQLLIAAAEALAEGDPLIERMAKTLPRSWRR